MSRDAKDTVYCNVQMPMAKGRELWRLVAELRKSGAYPELDSVFEEIHYELSSSIEFVEEQLSGAGGFGRRSHWNSSANEARDLKKRSECPH